MTSRAEDGHRVVLRPRREAAFRNSQTSSALCGAAALTQLLLRFGALFFQKLRALFAARLPFLFAVTAALRVGLPHALQALLGPIGLLKCSYRASTSESLLNDQLIITWQLQLPVAPQLLNAESMHCKPAQQGFDTEQAWPVPGQTAVPQIPEVAPL